MAGIQPGCVTYRKTPCPWAHIRYSHTNQRFLSRPNPARTSLLDLTTKIKAVKKSPCCQPTAPWPFGRFNQTHSACSRLPPCLWKLFDRKTSAVNLMQEANASCIIPKHNKQRVSPEEGKKKSNANSAMAFWHVDYCLDESVAQGRRRFASPATLWHVLGEITAARSEHTACSLSAARWGFSLDAATRQHQINWGF